MADKNPLKLDVVSVRMKKDTSENTSPQMERYRKEGFPEKYGLLQKTKEILLIMRINVNFYPK